MKKLVFICFALIVFCLTICIFANNGNDFLSIAQKFDAKISFYVATKQKLDDTAYIDNGVSCIIECDSKHATNAFYKLNNIIGISFSIQGDNDTFLQICEYYDIVIIEKDYIMKDLVTYLGYSSKITNSLQIEEQTINIQIALNNNKIVVGTPLILGSF